jgi:uncharacterized protein (DUF2147 family)
MNKRWIAILAMAAFSVNAWAQQPSPVGLWKNIDDKSGKPNALIRITESGGEYSGRIEKLFREAGEVQDPVCEKCSGDLKNKQVVGLTMLTGIKQAGDSFEGGQILDPDNGQSYKCKLTVADGGKTLKVRGYIGVPWIGRSQQWVRQE